jgi:competence protein ComEC
VIGAAEAGRSAEEHAGSPLRRPGQTLPAVPAALSLFSTTLVCLRLGRLPGWLFAAGLSFAALSVVLILQPPAEWTRRLKAAGTVSLCIAMGFGMGAARLWPLLPLSMSGWDFLPRGGHESATSRRAGMVWLGIPLEEVRRFEAVLLRDSSAIPGEATVYELRLLRVMSSQAERSTGAAAGALLWVEEGPPLAAGRLVEVEGRLQRPVSGQRPRLYCSVPPQALTVKGYRSPVAALRARMLEAVRLRLASLGAGAAGILAALILGSREEIATELYAGFRASGSLHLLALSGLHAGILFLLVSLLLWFVRRRTVRGLAASAVLLGYLFLAGFRPSLSRAVVMILTAAFGRLLDRDSRPLNLLALAAVVLLLIDPGASLTLSFQLSFLALAGILLLAPGIQLFLERVLPRVAAAPLAYSIGAQAATAPLLLVRFGSAHPIGILAALPLIPLVTALIWLGIAYLALAGTIAAAPLSMLILWLHRALQASVGWFAAVPPLFGPGAVSLVGLTLAAAVLLRVYRAPLLQPS